MKKLICVILAIMAILCMGGCGAQNADSAVAPNMQNVFVSMAAYLPEDAMAFDSDYVFNAYGVKPEDCKQQAVFSYYDGSVTAEIWLIEAVSEDALKSVETLAKSRLESMQEQFQSYDPVAYELTKDAKLFTSGNCLVFVVAENADKLVSIYSSAQ